MEEVCDSVPFRGVSYFIIVYQSFDSHFVITNLGSVKFQWLITRHKLFYKRKRKALKFTIRGKRGIPSGLMGKTGT